MVCSSVVVCARVLSVRSSNLQDHKKNQMQSKIRIKQTKRIKQKEALGPEENTRQNKGAFLPTVLGFISYMALNH